MWRACFEKTAGDRIDFLGLGEHAKQIDSGDEPFSPPVVQVKRNAHGMKITVTERADTKVRPYTRDGNAAV